MGKRDDKRGILDQWRQEEESGSEHMPVHEWLKRFVLGATMLQTSSPPSEKKAEGAGKHVSNPADIKSARESYNDLKGLIADVNKARLKTEFASDFPDITDLLNEIEGIDGIYEEILNKLGLRPIMGQVMQCIMELTGIPQGLGWICKQTIGQIPTDEFMKIFKRQSDGGFVPDALFSGLDQGLEAIPPNLNKELAATKQRNEINKFIKQLEDFLDFEKLCEDIEELAKKLPDTLMSPGGAKGAENDINNTVPNIPEPPTLTFPEDLPVDDLEKAAMADVRAGAKKAVMEALQEGIYLILELVLKYCRQAVEDLYGADPSRADLTGRGSNSQSPTGINDLLEDSLEDSTPYGNETPLPAVYRGALTSAGLDPEANKGLNDDDLKNLMALFSDALTAKQLCDLFHGEASERSLRIIKQVVMAHRKYYDLLAPTMLEKENIITLFKELGLFINREMCQESVDLARERVRAKFERVSNKPDPCPPGFDSTAGESSESVSEAGKDDSGDPAKDPLIDQQIQDILDDAFNDLGAVSDLFGRDPENLLQDSLPPIFCTDNEPGLFPRISEQTAMNNHRMIQSIWNGIENRFTGESVNYLNIFKVSEDSEMKMPIFSMNQEIDEDGETSGDPVMTRRIETKPLKLWHSFPTLKKSCKQAREYIEDRDKSHTYLEPPVFNFEDHNKLYGGMVSQGSIYSFKQTNELQKAVIIHEDSQTITGGGAETVGQLEFTDPATGRPMQGFEKPADLKLPRFIPEWITTDVMTYHVPAMWNLVKQGGVPLNNKFVFSLYKPIIEPVLGAVQGSTSDVPVPIDYKTKTELVYYRNMSSHLKTDVLEAIERVMPYTYSSPGIDLKTYMGGANTSSTDGSAQESFDMSDPLKSSTKASDSDLGSLTGGNPGTAGLGASEASLLDVDPTLLSTDPLEFLDNNPDAAFEALKNITNSKDILTEILDKLIAARSAIRQYGRQYWAVATVPWAVGTNDQVEAIQELSSRAMDSDNPYFNNANSVFYGQDVVPWDTDWNDPDALKHGRSFLHYDYNKEPFGFGALPDVNWDGTPLGLLLKGLPLPVGPNYYNYPYAPPPCQDTPDKVFEDGTSVAMPPTCPDIDDHPGVKWGQLPIRVMEAGYGWDLGGAGDYVAPAAVILECFMGLSNDFWEDIVYQADPGPMLGPMEVLYTHTFQGSRNLSEIDVTMEAVRGRLSPLVKSSFNPDSSEFNRVLDKIFPVLDSQNSAIYNKYGQVRSYFDLFRIYIKELNDPKNLYERLKIINLKLKEFGPSGPLASEADSGIHNYYKSLRTRLLSHIKDAIEAGEVDDKIVTHTFPARTYAKLATEKWAKVMTSMPEGTIKETIDWTSLNELFDERGDWYKAWAGVHWEENTERFLEMIMNRIGDSPYFDVRELDKVSMIGDANKVEPFCEDCGPPNYGQSSPPKPSVLRSSNIKVTVTEDMRKAQCKDNYPQEAGKSLGKGLLMSLIRLYVVEYALQGVFAFSMYRFGEIARNKLFLDYFVTTITDDIYSRSPVFYDIFLDHCSDMIDERLQTAAKLELDLDILKNTASLLEKYSNSDGQMMIGGYAIANFTDKRRALDKINSALSKKQAEYDRVKLVDPLTGELPTQLSLKSVLPSIPVDADSEKMQQVQAEIREAKKERIIFLLVTEILSLSQDVTERIAKRNFPSLRELAVNWIKSDTLASPQNRNSLKESGWAKNDWAYADWINSMPKVSDKSAYDFISGLQTEGAHGGAVQGLASTVNTKIYSSPQILEDGTNLEEWGLYDNTVILELTPDVKRVMDSNRRYFKDGAMSVLVRGDEYEAMADIFRNPGPESYLDWTSAMSKLAETGVYDDPEIEGVGNLSHTGGKASYINDNAISLLSRGKLSLQPYIHIERSAGYPTMGKIENEPDAQRQRNMQTDLHYLETIRNRIEWGSGKLPEMSLDATTGNLYIKGQEGNINHTTESYFFVSKVSSSTGTTPMTSSDIELCLTFPFIEGSHNITRGQALIALLMDGATSDLLGLDFANNLKNYIQWNDLGASSSNYTGVGRRFNDYFNVYFGMRLVQVDPLDTADPQDNEDLSKNTPSEGTRSVSTIGSGQKILEKVLQENNNTKVVDALRAQNSFRCREVHQINQLTMYKYDTVVRGEGTEDAQTLDTMLGASGNEDLVMFDTTVDAKHPLSVTSIKHIYETPLADTKLLISKDDLDVFLFQIILSREAPEIVSETPDYFYTVDSALIFSSDRRRAGYIEEYYGARAGHLMQVFQNPSFSVYERLRSQLIETDEFKILFDYVFPVDRLLGLSSIYCTHSARINFPHILQKYKRTKKLIISNYLSSMRGVGNMQFNNPEIDDLASEMFDAATEEGAAATGEDIDEWAIVMKAVLLIVGAVARITSPALATAEQIYKLIGAFIPDKQYKPPYYPTMPLLTMSLMPSPMFPPPPLFPSQTVLPMDPLGLAYLFSGVVPEVFSEWGVPEGKGGWPFGLGDAEDPPKEYGAYHSCMGPPETSDECKARIKELFDRLKAHQRDPQEFSGLTIAESQELASLQSGQGICKPIESAGLTTAAAQAVVNPATEDATPLYAGLGAHLTQQDTPGATAVGDMNLQQLMSQFVTEGQMLDLAKLSEALEGKVDIQSGDAVLGDSGGTPAAATSDEEKDFNF